MADNPNAARRELKEHMEKMRILHMKVIDALDDYYNGSDEKSVERHERWIREYLSKEWRGHMERTIARRKREAEEKAYKTRRDGIMRLRRMPVRCEARAHWYETGDGSVKGTVVGDIRKKPLRLHSKYKLSLAAGPKQRWFYYG